MPSRKKKNSAKSRKYDRVCACVLTLSVYLAYHLYYLESPSSFARPNDSASAEFLQDPDTELPDDDAFSEEAKPLNGLCSMPPAPPIHQILEDGSEEVVFPRSIFQMDDFTMALALWCEEAGISWAKHKALLEVLDLLDDGSRIRLLLRSLATLKHNLKSSLPLTKIRKKQIPLTAEKLSSMTPA